MSLFFALLFFAWFISAIIRGNFSYGKADYDFQEHPIQYVIVMIFILSVAILCFLRFLIEIDLIKWP